jgi:hypothetical protein
VPRWQFHDGQKFHPIRDFVDSPKSTAWCGDPQNDKQFWPEPHVAGDAAANHPLTDGNAYGYRSVISRPSKGCTSTFFTNENCEGSGDETQAWSDANTDLSPQCIMPKADGKNWCARFTTHQPLLSLLGGIGSVLRMFARVQQVEGNETSLPDGSLNPLLRLSHPVLSLDASSTLVYLKSSQSLTSLLCPSGERFLGV